MRRLLLKHNECTNRSLQLCTFALVLTLFIGCSTASKNSTVPLMKMEPEDFIDNPGTKVQNQPIVIRNSKNDNRPEWVHSPTFEKGDSIYFTGGFLHGSDYSVTLRCANAEALKSVIQAVGQFIRLEFSMFTKGSNSRDGSVDRYIEDGLAAFAKNIQIQGIRTSESYYEEVIAPSEPEKPYFNAWVKLEINKTDYQKAKAIVLNQLKNRFHSSGRLEAKEKVEALLNSLKEQVSGTL